MYKIKIAMLIINMLIDANFQKYNLLKIIIPKFKKPRRTDTEKCYLIKEQFLLGKPFTGCFQNLYR